MPHGPSVYNVVKKAGASSFACSTFCMCSTNSHLHGAFATSQGLVLGHPPTQSAMSIHTSSFLPSRTLQRLSHCSGAVPSNWPHNSSVKSPVSCQHFPPASTRFSLTKIPRGTVSCLVYCPSLLLCCDEHQPKVSWWFISPYNSWVTVHH